MGRELAAEHADPHAVWERLRDVRLLLGREWPSETHVEAVDEYARLDGADVRTEAKIDAYREWLTARAARGAVDAEFEALAQIAGRFPSGGPVKRLRLTLPD